MNWRKRKKLKNRAGFFHYKSYKWRVKLLYDMFSRVVNHQAPYAFKQLMFDYAKNMLFTKPPKKIYDRNLRYKPFLTNCVGTSVGKYADIAKPDVIPSMSIRMVGDKAHSFSIYKDSFKNGYKPGELAVPLPKGPFDGYKSMSSVKLSAIHDDPTMASAKLTIENGDTNRMHRHIMADEYIKGGSAIEYPDSAIIDLRKLADERKKDPDE